VKFEAASADAIQRYEDFGSRLLADETLLYRKRLFFTMYLYCSDFVHVQNVIIYL